MTYFSAVVYLLGLLILATGFFVPARLYPELADRCRFGGLWLIAFATWTYLHRIAVLWDAWLNLGRGID